MGRTGDGKMVVRLAASRRPREVEVKAGWGTAMTAGRWLSIASLLAALGLVAAGLAARRRRPPGD